MIGELKASGRHIVLLPALTIGAAVSATGTTPHKDISGATYLTAQAKFLYGAGGTTVTAYVQTSLDDGVTWMDIMSFAFTTAAATKVSLGSILIGIAAVTPTDGSLTDDTVASGPLGDWIRLKYVTTGTYTGATSLQVDIVVKG